MTVDDARNLLIGLADAAVAHGGTSTVTCETEALPALAAMETEKSYLSWRVVLPAAVPEESVHAVFDWVSDVCDVTITREGGSGPSGGESAPESAEAPAIPEPPAPERPSLLKPLWRLRRLRPARTRKSPRPRPALRTRSWRNSRLLPRLRPQPRLLLAMPPPPAALWNRRPSAWTCTAWMT
ncbi:hypothetical protein [Acetobacter okinawensis]|uniref:hypothetical protein n=1 Tax=Acetobacter okinawensis TaxID=1076594 RepID=UPI001F57310F|nr:hypothetical protein [Acetobacter okinawensis]